MRALGSLMLSAALLGGCSLTTAGGLSECETSTDCGENQVCTANFCVPLPAGCGERYGDPSADAVQIGAALPLSLSATNPDAGKDESEQQGINAILLALEEINQRGAAGKKLALHFCDTAGDPARTALQTQWLVTEKKIVALMTGGSTQTLAASEVTLKNNVLTMSSSATSPELAGVADRNGGTVGLLWRTAPSDVIQGKVVANLLATDSRFASATKIGLLYLDDPYGQGLFNVITGLLKPPAKIVKAFPYTRRTESTITSAVTKLDAEDPDLTVVVGFEDDASLIVKRASNTTHLKASAGHRWFFTDSAKDQALLEDATVKAQVQDAYGTAPAPNGGQAFDSFQSRFIAKYGRDPSNFSFTAHSYDSMYLFGLAVAYSQGTSGTVTGPKMAEGLTRLSSGKSYQLTSVNFLDAAGDLAANRSIDVEGASGSLLFDDTGEAPSPIELWQVTNDVFRQVATVPPPP
ncbi:ABC transporter substrate-binding protein [Hyalangium gracile]|uniref:ABC transporter substrate-binding protein n=1 Tax=Hyalangium gracile TaxID=394092 RepID=UPI001CCAE9F8|nr:ABC transporter substrate-binding protein [Hyalangium gracile]